MTDAETNVYDVLKNLQRDGILLNVSPVTPRQGISLDDSRFIDPTNGKQYRVEVRTWTEPEKPEYGNSVMLNESLTLHPFNRSGEPSDLIFLQKAQKNEVLNGDRPGTFKYRPIGEANVTYRSNVGGDPVLQKAMEYLPQHG